MHRLTNIARHLRPTNEGLEKWSNAGNIQEECPAGPVVIIGGMVLDIQVRCGMHVPL